MLKRMVLCVVAVMLFSLRSIETRCEPLVYDCFPFFNELDLLEIRLNVLDEVVDKFVIVEMSKTYTGLSKPFYFEQNKSRFEKFLHKIIHIKVEDVPSTEGVDKRRACWILENYQRDQIMRGLKNAKDSDIVLISDCDEIPNPVLIREYKYNRGSGIRVFTQSIYYFFLNNFCHNQKIWHGTRMGRFFDLKNPNQDLQAAREYFKYSKKGLPTYFRFCKGVNLPSGGWHFTFCGGVDGLKQKVNAFAHADEFKNEKIDDEYIKNAISKSKWKRFAFKIVPIDKSFPKYLRENQRTYKNFILDVPHYSVFDKFEEFCKSLVWNLKKSLIYLLCFFHVDVDLDHGFFRSNIMGCGPGETALVP